MVHPPMPLWRDWRAARAMRGQARRYAAVLGREPADDDVRWLAEHGTGGDVDHARWELRYARRALGLLTAQRDALDDRTASVVARALAEALSHDRAVGAGKLRVAERQFNVRLRGYADALSNREGEGSGWHLGRALLGFAGRRDAVSADVVAHGAEVLSRYLSEGNAALREHFGAAALPDDVVPSSLSNARR